MIEIRIRALLMSDHGMRVVPGTTLIAEKAPPALDIAKVVADLIAELSPSLGNLRHMNAEEADAFTAEEEADEREGYVDLGLVGSDEEECGS